MKIGLIGYGQMGRLVEETARHRGMEVVARFTRNAPLTSDRETRARLEDVSSLIDFSVGAAVPGTVCTACELSRNLVIGTTGWADRLNEIRDLVESAGIGVVYGSNFSTGTHLFYRLVEQAARAICAFEEYDPFLQESHHKKKRDSPSGTALEVTRLLEPHYPIGVPTTSLRAGYVPGTHAVGFDSPADTIVIEHRARNRTGFAAGALAAATWLEGRSGFYEFGRVLEEMQ